MPNYDKDKEIEEEKFENGKNDGYSGKENNGMDI